jgi:hypothetical protein
VVEVGVQIQIRFVKLCYRSRCLVEPSEPSRHEQGSGRKGLANVNKNSLTEGPNF